MHGGPLPNANLSRKLPACDRFTHFTGLTSVPNRQTHTETHTETMQHVKSVAIGRIENCSQFCTVNWKYTERECKGLFTAHELQ